MKDLLKLVVAGVALVAVVGIFNTVRAIPDHMGDSAALGLTRGCIPVSGPAEDKLSVTSSAGTGELSANSMYRIWCSVDAYYELGDAANPTADNTSIPVAKKSVEYFATGSGYSQYLAAVDQAAASGTCWVSRCR